MYNCEGPITNYIIWGNTASTNSRSHLMLWVAWFCRSPVRDKDGPESTKENRHEKRYVVRLSTEERSGLQRLVSVGKAAARKIIHAHVLLQADEVPTVRDGPTPTSARHYRFTPTP